MSDQLELAESLSMAFLVVLEKLAPVERVVFLLHDIFDYEYAEIGEMIGKSKSNVRQIAHRAREHVNANRPRFEATPAEQEHVTEQFLEACAGGDIQALLGLLAPNVLFTADGGGKTPAATRPVSGAERVAAMIVGWLAKAPPDYRIRVEAINGQPALVGYFKGVPYNVMSFRITDEQVTSIWNVVNPDKLGKIPARGVDELASHGGRAVSALGQGL